MDNDIFLLLGSNQGDRAANLAAARDAIGEAIGTIVKRSSVYRTAAWGTMQQPDFYNQVLEVSSSLAPEKLLTDILAIEKQLGRVRKERWGPRLIDIDLLLYGSRVIDTPALTVPHPGIPFRRFTLVPLAQIVPTLMHPVLNKSMAQLLQECQDPLIVELCPKEDA